MNKLIGLILVAFLVAGACSDGDGISVVTDETAAGSGDGGDNGDGGGGDNGGENGDGGGGDDGGENGGGENGGGDGGDTPIGGGDWCDFARQVDAANDDLDFESSPEALEAAFTEFNGLLNEARARAPGEISDAVDRAADAFNVLEGELRSVNFDLFELDLAAFSELDTPELQEATDAIDIYNERECGIPREEDPFDDPGDDEPLPTDGTVRDAIVEGFVQGGFTQEEAECLADNVTLEELSNAEDPEQLFEIFERCGISLDRLAELGG